MKKKNFFSLDLVVGFGLWWSKRCLICLPFSTMDDIIDVFQNESCPNVNGSENQKTNAAWSPQCHLFIYLLWLTSKFSILLLSYILKGIFCYYLIIKKRQRIFCLFVQEKHIPSQFHRIMLLKLHHIFCIHNDRSI